MTTIQKYLENSRKTFEEWASSSKIHGALVLDLTRNGEGYDNKSTQKYWVGWKACALLHNSSWKRELI